MIWFCRVTEDAQPPALWGGVIGAVVLAVVAVTLLPVALASPSPRVLRRLAVGCAVFQVGHGSEHVAQFMGLVGPGGLTFTWWARELAYGYAFVMGRDAHVGLEGLHFFGDLVYLCGVIAWWRLRRSPLAGAALAIQGAHQVEHTFLVLTGWSSGVPMGATTTGSVGQRIVMHFVLNLGGSLCWVADALLARRSR